MSVSRLVKMVIKKCDQDISNDHWTITLRWAEVTDVQNHEASLTLITMHDAT
jgi:hypothetical protein